MQSNSLFIYKSDQLHHHFTNHNYLTQSNHIWCHFFRVIKINCINKFFNVKYYILKLINLFLNRILMLIIEFNLRLTQWHFGAFPQFPLYAALQITTKVQIKYKSFQILLNSIEINAFQNDKGFIART